MSLDKFLVKTKKESKPLNVKHIYICSRKAFENYCKNCPHLIKVEETGSKVFPFRIFCDAEKCVK